jgi:hypothetical protein
MAALAAFGGCKSRAGTSALSIDSDKSPPVGGADATRPRGCNLICSTAQDCAVSSGLQDASHFQCVSNHCQWTGCASNEECTKAYQSDKYICAKEGGALLSDCIRTCSTAADCAGQASGSDDATHYQCTANRCQWTGCKSNAECSSAYQNNKFVCVKEGTVPIPVCVLDCDAPSDCVAPGSGGPDASRFTCTNHRCSWLGCASTAECKTLYGNDKVVCE